MSRTMFADLEKATKENKPLTFGAASYWAMKLFRSPDHYTYDHDLKFKQALVKAIEKSANIQKLAKSCAYTDEQIKPYAEEQYLAINYDKNAGLPIMLRAGLDILKSDENAIKQFAFHSQLSLEEAQQAADLLTKKVDDITKCSTRQWLKDAFSRNIASREKLEAASYINGIFACPGDM